MPRVTVTEPSGGAKLNKVVLTFVYSGGNIVRIRSDPTCENTYSSYVLAAFEGVVVA